MRPLTDLSGFEELNVANRLAALLGQAQSTATPLALRDARPQLNLARWNWTLRNFGRGVLNGQLIFDNALPNADRDADATNAGAPSARKSAAQTVARCFMSPKASVIAPRTRRRMTTNERIF